MAHAETADTAKQKLQSVEQTLAEKQAAAAALDAAHLQASASLSELQAQLVAAAASLQTQQEQAAQLAEKQVRLEADIKAKQADLATQRHLLAELTEALLNLGRTPPASLVLETGLTNEAIDRSLVLRAVLPALRQHTDTLLEDLQSLHDLQAQLTQQQQAVTASQQTLAAQSRNLNQLLRARQGMLQQTEAQKAAIAAQLVALSSQANDLRQLMEQLSKPPRGKTRQAERGPAPSLKWPVAGPILRGYGEHDADGVTSQGVTFTTLPSAPVLAPAPGKVVFEGPFKGYGQIVILQHKNGYHSFLAGLGRIDADMGQELSAGEPLGVMPARAGEKPELYFEWRRNNEPVDPSVARK